MTLCHPVDLESFLPSQVRAVKAFDPYITQNNFQLPHSHVRVKSFDPHRIQNDFQLRHSQLQRARMPSL